MEKSENKINKFKNNMKINVNAGRLIIVVMMLLIVVIGGTFAWFTFKSKESSLVLSIGDINDSKVIITPYQIREKLIPSNTYEDGVYTQITAINNNSNKMLVTLFYRINQMDEVLINNGLKYTIVSSSIIDGEYEEVDTGDFTALSNSRELVVLNTKIDENTTLYYRVYLWLDTNAGNQVVVQNSVLDVELNGRINYDVNAPVLDDGMIPVIISDDGSVMSTIESDMNWYDYNSQKWANIVLVKELSTDGIEGSYSREYYLNNPGTKVLESDILGYYVWIPRYRYKIWTTGVSSTGNEQPIDIVFESRTEPMSLGINVDEYRTHPAFWWDSNNDGAQGNGEMLPGIWVGKFETTGDISTPTVKPNVASLVNQNVSTQFNTSLKFAGGSMNSVTGEVTFAGNNTYGLTVQTDSHMIKNGEWGAVAYLSHSAYGINEEVRINNYYNSATLTGCGALTVGEAKATTCGISYGTPSSEIHTYPQSTTGNITGVFDMSGGTWEYVMGNYNNTTGSGGFSVFPDKKYYDLYTATDVSTACNGGICYGQALSETYGWHAGYSSFVTSQYPWSGFGGAYNNADKAGLFSLYVYDGGGYNNYALRSVLIPNYSYTINFDPNGGSLDISYTDVGEHEFTVPATGEYQLELWGASGGNGYVSDGTTYAGGYGGYTAGNIYLNNDEELYLYIGGAGLGGKSNSVKAGGYNGGGSSSYYSSGGGATDVRLINGEWDNNASLSSRIMVAGGGGGVSADSSGGGYCNAGSAGGLEGGNGVAGSSNYGVPGIGAKQTSGYAFGIGNSGTETEGSAGGGGGYYGASFGGGTSSWARCGGGGSSYISGHTGCVAVVSSTSTNARTGTNSATCTTGSSDNLCSIHYSDKVFTDTVMIDGTGYRWTNVKGSLQQMPNPSGGYYASGVGHTGDGAARISQSSFKVVVYNDVYGNLPIPTREGYTFMGWYTELQGGSEITSDTVLKQKENQILYARWKANTLYINFDVNGGNIQSSTLSSDGNTTNSWSAVDNKVYLNDEILNFSINFEETKDLFDYNDINYMNITKDGYGVQIGEEWRCLSGCKSQELIFNQAEQYTVSDFCDNSQSECNVVLGVNWAKKYTITYNLNGGSGGPDNQIKLDGYNLGLSDVEPTKDGYIFLGWSEDPNATSATYEKGSEYTSNENVSLYAVWVMAKIPLFTYSGTYQIVDDSDNVISDPDSYVGDWKIRLLSDGNLVFNELYGANDGIDIFIVGGGGGGARGSSYSSASRGGGGGGGGASITVKRFPAKVGVTYGIDIGGAGATSSFKEGTTAYFTALAGSTSANPYLDSSWHTPVGAGGAGRLSGQTGNYGALSVVAKAGASGGGNGNYEFFGTTGKRYGAGGGTGGHGASTGYGGYGSSGNAGGANGGGAGGSGCDYISQGGGKWKKYNADTGGSGGANTGSGGGGGGGACGNGSTNSGGNASGGSGGSGIVIIRNYRK